MSAFQESAFQVNAFQIDSSVVVVPPRRPIGAGGGYRGIFPRKIEYAWVEADLFVEWKVYAEAVAELSSWFVTKNYVDSRFGQSWTIRHFIDGETMLAWSVTAIDRVAEWNRKILLGEIDEDLMLVD